MSKRHADTERIGDNPDFGSDAPSSEPHQVQRATAAQMAARNVYAKALMNRSVPDNVRIRIARPRGGRRPAPTTRPPNAQNSPLAQSFPAPSWGTANSANAQQPSSGFTFGQQAGGENQSIFSQSSSFPPFGAQNAQQPAAPSSTGFNFSAPSNGPPINNPFAAASFNQSSTPQAASNGFSGNIFNMPQSTTAQSNNVRPSSGLDWKTPAPDSVEGWKTPSHTMNKDNLKDIYREKDPQSFFVAHAPFKWGQADPPKHESSQQSFNEPATNNAAQQNTQPTSNLFGFNEPPKHISSSIFANPQQQTPSPSPFGQQATPQSQPTNMFGQASNPSSQAQSGQMLTNIFGQANNPHTSGVGNFAKSAISPTKNGDAMSTTPDTSPQTNKDSDRYGAFASALAKPSPAFGDGGTPNASASNIFGFPSNPSQNQQSSTTINEESRDNSSDPTSQLGSGPKPSDVSFGSPTKNQKPTQSNFRQSQSDQATAPDNFRSTGFGWSAAPAANTPASISSPSKPPLIVGETNGDSSSKAAESTIQTDATKAMDLIRESGIPQPPPGQFTEEQSRQLITGYRLRQLDQGLQSYLEYSSWGDDEVESISTYYQLQKKAILRAKGGPVKKVMNKKREANFGESSNKRARRQAPKASTGSSNSLPAQTSFGRNSLSKRKADEDVSKEASQMNGIKRSKANDQVTYPSLPESSNSQTSKLFGNLLGKTTQQKPSVTGETPSHEHLSNGSSSNDDHSSVKATGSGSSLFFPTPKPNDAEGQKTSAKDTPRTGFPNFSPQASSTPLQSKSNGIFDQPSNPQDQSPFKGFLPSKASSTNSGMPPSNSRLAAPSSSQFTNTSSPFKFLNSGAVSPKPTSNDSEQKAEVKESSHDAVYDHQRAKAAPKDNEVPSSTLRTTTEQAGFGESIFSRPSAKPGNTSNIFGHLASSTSGEVEDDDEGGETEETGNVSSAADEKNDSTSAVFNPFASASFTPASTPSSNPFANATVPPNLKPLNADQPSGGRSLFDRIEKDSQGAPVKDAKSVDFGQSILQTPKTSQAIGNGFGGFGAASNTLSASTPPSFGVFGQSSTPPAGASASSNSPSGDNTWKAGTPLKFASSTTAPSFNLTAPSPTKTPLTGLFGAPKASTPSETPSSQAKPAPLTFGISAPPKDSSESLAPPSGTQSESTSRATSPGAPSSDNGNEASDEVHEAPTHPELDAAEANKAEADEDTIFEAMAKVHELAPQKTRNPQTGKEEHSHKWITRGHEQFRVLKNRETKKTRMLMKLKVNGRVILNAGLQQSLTYNLATPKQVRVPVPADGKITTWHIQVGKETAAQELVNVLEANKAN
ncbi:MAG: hypothetical protein Q9174_000587 [Haloplaca sp. 1 TL-2023]